MKPIEKPKPKIDIHESGLVATHDQSCHVCLVEPAIYEINSGEFKPCSSCESDGWVYVCATKWQQRIMRLIEVTA